MRPYRRNSQNKSIRRNGVMPQLKIAFRSKRAGGPPPTIGQRCPKSPFAAIDPNLVPTHIAAEVHAAAGNRMIPLSTASPDLLDTTGGNGKLPAALQAEVIAVSSDNFLHRRIVFYALRGPNIRTRNLLPFGLPLSSRSGNERPQPFRNPKR